MKTTKRWRHTWVKPDGERLLGVCDAPTYEVAVENRNNLIERSKIPANGDYSGYFNESWDWAIEGSELQVLLLDNDTVCVLLDEEYGYRTWLWHTGMSPAQLKDYWEGLPSVTPFFRSPTGLPGTVVPAWFVQGGALRTFLPESMILSEDTLNAEGPEAILFDGDSLWGGHINQEGDSGIGNDEHTFRHRGYKNASTDH
jgi:hypothetical protein